MRKVKLILTVIIVSLLLLLLGSCGEEDAKNMTSQEKATDSEEVEEMVMPEDLGTTKDLNSFATIDIYGNQVDNEVFSDYEYTIIDVWGTYCTPCINAMPDMKKVYDEYKDKGVNVMGIVIDVQNADRSPQMEGIKKARTIVEKQGADFTHILIPKNLLYSFMMDIQFIPTQFIVDSEGNIISNYYEGGKSYEQWCKILDEKLDNKKQAVKLEN
ncbi:TlpA family protein disulfide reductase [Aminipila sp.]|uniref:TlpA family protein disulfide reductase n=1 Tax=Aminipila sp. TaxID=2060095 RepID=UPI00289B64EE|nr:TlpA disulfide reductase family protein [Aminipila sp.]